MRRCVLGLAVCCWCVAWTADADEPGTTTRAESVEQQQGPTPLKPSLESMVAWTDQYYFHRWRIQSHVETEECRLLDGDDKLHAQGTFDKCLAALDRIRDEQQLPRMSGKAVILLHGLAAPRWSMKLLARHLEKNGDYVTFTMEYASLRTNIDNHASSLANVIRSLEGIQTIHLVGHSMGNIVIRRYLAGNDSQPHVWQADARIARIVMIAPPNHGSITATRLSDTSAFQTIFGKSGRQLGSEWKDLQTRLAIPQTEFGIIAGGFGNSIGLNPFLPGDDDGRITVETTRLTGAQDFQVVSAVHELIANDPRVFDLTLRFMEEGHFISESDRVPIRADSVAQRPGQQPGETTR